MRTEMMKVRGIVFSLSLLVAAGCGSGGPSLVPVSGTVTLDGKPLEGATITFIPDPSNAKPQTDGGDVTGPGGTFASTYRNRAGLAPGKYKVVVTKPSDSAASGQASKLPSEITKSSYMANLATSSGAGAKAAEAPWPYGDGAKTPLSQEVSANGETNLTFGLKSTVK
jgi:hypothetical protein